MRAIRESRELLRNQGIHNQAAQVGLVIEELADLMTLLAPWLRNLSRELRQEQPDQTTTQQLAHVLRAARIVQMNSLIHHFLGSVLASAEPVPEGRGNTTTETWNPFSGRDNTRTRSASASASTSGPAASATSTRFSRDASNTASTRFDGNASATSQRFFSVPAQPQENNTSSQTQASKRKYDNDNSNIDASSSSSKRRQ
jgi:hypothetical protein